MHTEYFDFKNGYEDDILNRLGNNLQNGTVGIFPTDTVYGIGCNALDDHSINQLFVLKNRDYSKPINVLISNIAMLDSLVDTVSDIEKTLMKTFWPGPLTIIFNKKKNISKLLTSNLDTIGIRMPSDPITLKLISYAGVPLATTSANLSGFLAGIEVSDFYRDFKNKIDFVIDAGSSNIKVPSTIVRVTNQQVTILREGSITKNDIQKCLGGMIHVK